MSSKRHTPQLRARRRQTALAAEHAVSPRVWPSASAAAAAGKTPTIAPVRASLEKGESQAREAGGVRGLNRESQCMALWFARTATGQTRSWSKRPRP